jgi:hypothetical protein
MPSAQRTILITSPPEQVFAFFTDTRKPAVAAAR